MFIEEASIEASEARYERNVNLNRMLELKAESTLRSYGALVFKRSALGYRRPAPTGLVV